MFKRTGKLAWSKMQWPSRMTIIEITPFRNGWQVYESASVQPVFLNQQDATTPLAALAFGQARFAFSIRAATSNASFRLVRRIADCDVSAVDVLTAESTSHGLRVREIGRPEKEV
jgi:hypothetical protein